MSDGDGVLGNEGFDEGKWDAALELGRIIAYETGICCQDLASVVWDIYTKLSDENDDTD